MQDLYTSSRQFFVGDLPDLNTEQKKAVEQLEGTSLIIAGAGTGKTHTLISKVINVMKAGAAPESIMLLTFTNKAAQEMTRRVQDYIGRPVYGMMGGTFHSVAVRLLRTYGREINIDPSFTIIDTDDAESLLNTALRELHLNEQKKFPKKSVLQSMHSFMKNKDLSLNELLTTRYRYWLECEDSIAEIFKKYAAAKKKGNCLDFDDLLNSLLLLLRTKITGDKIRARYTWIFVDEYQDTNKIQNEIIKYLSTPQTRLTVVGDDAQSIYSFRGACFQNILQFPDTFHNTQIFKLQTNYRSTEAILEFSNAIIQKNTRQFRKELVSGTKQKGNPPKVYRFNTDNEQAFGVTEMIRHKLREGADSSKIAVFYRSHMHSIALQLTLTKMNTPFHITSGMGFFDQAHVKDMLCFLRVIHNPMDLAALSRMLHMIPTVGQQTALKVLTYLPSSGKAKEVLETLFIHLPPKAKAAFEACLLTLRPFMGGEPFSPALLIEALLEDPFFINHVHSSYENAAQREDDLKYLAHFSSSYQDLATFLSEAVLMTNADDRREKSKKGILLSTVHQAKGLEWDYVYIVWLSEGFFPSYQSIDSDDDIEEERRLFYVASTRAKKELVITFPMIDEKARNGILYLKPSRFISELDNTLYQFRDLSGRT